MEDGESLEHYCKRMAEVGVAAEGLQDDMVAESSAC
jgi:hypothetical protein